MSKRETLLEMVRCIREGIKTSPGLSHAPFSDEGWAIIEEALSPEENALDVEAIGWALRKLEAFGLQTKTENALMMDRLKLMILSTSSPQKTT